MMPIVVGAHGTVSKSSEMSLEERGNQRNNWDHTDHSNETLAGILRKVLETS